MTVDRNSEATLADSPEQGAMPQDATPDERSQMQARLQAVEREQARLRSQVSHVLSTLSQRQTLDPDNADALLRRIQIQLLQAQRERAGWESTLEKTLETALAQLQAWLKEELAEQLSEKLAEKLAEQRSQLQSERDRQLNALLEVSLATWGDRVQASVQTAFAEEVDRLSARWQRDIAILNAQMQILLEERDDLAERVLRSVVMALAQSPSSNRPPLDRKDIDISTSTAIAPETLQQDDSFSLEDDRFPLEDLAASEEQEDSFPLEKPAVETQADDSFPLEDEAEDEEFPLEESVKVRSLVQHLRHTWQQWQHCLERTTNFLRHRG